MENAKLNEFDKVERFDVCRVMRPDLTWEEYEVMWDEFQSEKSQAGQRLSVN